MMTDAVPGILILGSVIAGFAWRQDQFAFANPEWLRLLTTPLWTGASMVILGWFISVTRHAWTAARDVDAAKFGPASVASMALSYGILCF